MQELRLEQIKLLLPDVEVMGEIGGSTDRLRLKCLIDETEWSPTFGNVVNRGDGCPTCAGKLPLTSEIVDSRLEGRDIKRIGDYVNSRTKIDWGCSKGHTWPASPLHIFAGKGCPTCAGNLPLTNEVVDSRLEGRSIKRVGAYANHCTKILWGCAKGHTWLATPDHVLNSQTGCPTCAKNHNCIYLWNVVGTNNYKIGISSIDIAEKRIKGCANAGNHKYEVIRIQEVEDPASLEKELLMKYTENPYKNERFDGYTEFRSLTTEQVEEIKQRLNKETK